MKVRDYLEETWEALDANRGRSLLTILGIVIGIAAVITMTALIGGIRQSVMGELGASQARLVYMNVFTGQKALSEQDLAAMMEDLPDYESFSRMVSAGAQMGSDASGNSTYCSITGTSPGFFSMTGVRLKAGRFFNETENSEASSVIILDEQSAHRLFGSDAEGALGQTLRLDSGSFTVIGVYENTSASSDMVLAYMPINTVERRLGDRSGGNSAVALAQEGTDMAQLVTATTSWLKSRYHLSDEEADGGLYVYSMQSVIDQVNSVMMSFQILMTSVASISLLVGGIGIMNMMLTNVTERIREIGLRKALGARASDITKQFLLESIILCITGGIFGIVFGYIGALGISVAADSFFASSGLGHLAPVIDPVSVAAATGICVLIGVIFGYGPARRAAKLDPIEALRYQ